MLREDPFRLRQSNPDQMIHLDTQWTLSAGSLKAASLLSSACSRFQSHVMFFFSMKKPLHLSSWPRTLVLVPPRDLQVPVVGTDHLGEPTNVLLQHQVPGHVCLRVGVQCRHVDLQMLIVTSKSNMPQSWSNKSLSGIYMYLWENCPFHSFPRLLPLILAGGRKHRLLLESLPQPEDGWIRLAGIRISLFS